MKKNHFIISSGIALFTCIMIFAILSFDKAATRGYDLNQPAVQWSLPDTLREISGITLINETTVACIQDENGILFVYNLDENDIQRQQPFHLNGDYEGIAKAGSTIYVLRSDGMLFAIERYNSARPLVDSIATGIPVDNNEGLCYDANENRLLIACKNKSRTSKDHKNTRSVYAFDLKTKTCSPEPVFNFDLNDLKRFALEKQVNFPMKEKKQGDVPEVKEPVIKFRPSEIAIHPVTNQIYLLSAMDYALFVFSPNGKLEDIRLLDKELFNKAEGITFLDNGDMLISNEGQQKKPTLLRFNYDPK
jgi:hypothetical protein